MMSSTVSSPFVPILTVMVDYGNAPFLWLVDSPDQGGVGGKLCDGVSWDASCPMSEGLWRKFADWAIAFDQTRFYSESFDDRDWDWRAFHARGLQLAQWLKEEVGEAYRVIYKKPGEDPNHRIDERREIRIDGTRVPLPPLARCEEYKKNVLTLDLLRNTAAEQKASDKEPQERHEIALPSPSAERTIEVQVSNETLCVPAIGYSQIPPMPVHGFDDEIAYEFNLSEGCTKERIDNFLSALPLTERNAKKQLRALTACRKKNVREPEANGT